jgi:4-carboxymuconolactone decarboxylase
LLLFAGQRIEAANRAATAARQEACPMPRIPVLAPEKLTPEQKEVWDAIASGPRGVVQGPLNVWLNSPGLAQRAQDLGAFCRYGTSLPPRLSELAILVTGAHWRAGFEWWAHAPIAAKAGLDPAAIAAIKAGGTPSFDRADEAAVYAFAHELLTTREVSKATYAKATLILGELGVVDLVGILGYYGLISMTIKAFEVPVPEGQAEPFA